MRHILIITSIFFGISTLALLTFHSASAQVWIPDKEFTSYFDSDGIFTVVGAVKNSESYNIVPTVTITIHDNKNTISKSFELTTVISSKDLPFKIKFPVVSSKNPVVETPLVTYVASHRDVSNVEVIYGKTLVKHDDGHLTGYIENKGTLPIYGIKVRAVIYDKSDKLLDVAESVEDFSKMEAGEIRSFSMYPDPSLASKVGYYSCFVIGDQPVIDMHVKRAGKQFDFRYLSSAYFDNAKFDDDKKTLTLFARNPWPMMVYANIEFPRESDNQKFVVYVGDKLINPLQSADENGNWHIAFNLDPQSSTNVLISGFVDKEADLQIATKYLLLGIIPAAAIAGIVIQRKRKNAGSTTN